MKRTTIVLPDDLYERLRFEAFQKRASLSRLIRFKLEGGSSPAPRRRRKDPILEVAGTIEDGSLASGIDEALYGAD